MSSSRIPVSLLLCFVLCSCGGSVQNLHPSEADTVGTTEPRALPRTSPDPNHQLPPAARQLEEGYWLGAMFQDEDVATLRSLGIKIVLSAVNPSESTRLLLQQAGIEQVRVPLSDHFAHGDRILETIDRFAPQEVFIHCRHGADRTGAIAAFLLVVRHDWNITDALYSVVYRSQRDTDGLASVFREFGIDDTRNLDDPSVGFYSLAALGRVGGLKARNERYALLVFTTIEAMIQYSL